ncbi:LysM peptidoglycan-binding domain-containing protein [Lachnospira pectinoschiza]|uniref:LysM domain-containing protein n=1 Tax=Lachnospira pectinoschiza TaxID=28052 RepID=A0A1G9VFP2_9FIRM|nr:LysM peptidoglycan-binding domain-containing protein [Lachnospira pectinoschiza]SDM70926.1 LysM domain-containing protein [Lachnospira pectinoschiza]
MNMTRRNLKKIRPNNYINTREAALSKRTIERRKRRARRLRTIFGIKLSLISFAVLMITVVTIVAFFNINAKASETNEAKMTTKYYTSIEIKNNDTLWNLEDQYNNGNESKKNYINNIMELNNLNSETIYSGESLIVYYYGSNHNE